MTGPEHYREAEAVVTEIHGDEQADKILAVAALAQVHATLALAAAAALNGHDLPSEDWDAWYDAASEYTKASTP